MLINYLKSFDFRVQQSIINVIGVFSSFFEENMLLICRDNYICHDLLNSVLINWKFETNEEIIL